MILKEENTKLILGMDECGTGALAGPAFFCGVIASLDWKLDCLNDSKKLHPIKREKAFIQIIESKIQYKIVSFSAAEIDSIGLAAIFRLAYKEIIDYFSNQKPIKTILDGKNKYGLEVEAVIEADGKIPTVSTASIIAKVSRDRLMIDYGKQYPNFMFEKHKGYGTKVHKEAIEKYGICDLHRKSYLGLV